MIPEAEDFTLRNDAINKIYSALEAVLQDTDFCVEKDYKFSQSYSVNPYTLKIDPKDTKEAFDVPLCIGKKAPSGIVVPRVCIDIKYTLSSKKLSFLPCIAKAGNIKKANSFIRYGVFCLNANTLDKNLLKISLEQIDFVHALGAFMEDKGKLESYLKDFAKEETYTSEFILDIMHNDGVLQSIRRERYN